MASETIKGSYRQWKDGSLTWESEKSENLSASCQEDPWLSEWPCLPPGSSSRTILTKTVRAYLQQQYASQRAAPEILELHDGGVFDYPVDLTVKVRHHPDHNVRFKIEWRTDTNQPWKSVTNSIIYGIQTSNGVTTAKMRPIKIGKWVLRAQPDTSADPWWSDPCTFTVNEGAPTLKFLSPNPGQVFSENSTILFHLYMESGTPWKVGDAEGSRAVLFETWWKPLPKEGGIEPFPIKIASGATDKAITAYGTKENSTGHHETTGSADYGTTAIISEMRWIWSGDGDKLLSLTKRNFAGMAGNFQ